MNAAVNVMITARGLNIAGLLASLLGVLMLFRYGMPYRVRSDGVTYIVTEDIDETEKSLDRRYAFLSYVGLVLVIVGTVLQGAGALIS